MVKKIAVEEHCLCPGFEEYWAPTVADMPTHKCEALLARLTGIWPCRTPPPPRTNSNARCASSNSAARWSTAIPTGSTLTIAPWIRSGNERKRSTRSSICTRPIPSRLRPCWTATRDCGGRRGNGHSRPARTRCVSYSEAFSIASRARNRLARVAYHFRGRFRSLPARAACARPFGRNAAVLAMAFR